MTCSHCQRALDDITQHVECMRAVLAQKRVGHQQKTWRDVTAECESGFYEENGRISLTHRTDFWDVLKTPGYRLTKISGPLKPHVAFIVEKRE